MITHTVNTYEAKTHFSRLLDAVNQGEEIVIARSGRPIARLVPMEFIKPRRKFGVLKGQITIADDFDAPLPPDILKDFEG